MIHADQYREDARSLCPHCFGDGNTHRKHCRYYEEPEMTIPATVVDLTMHYITGITIKRLTGSLGSTWYEIIVKDHSGAPLIVTAFCRPDVALELLGDIPVVASVAA